MNVLYSAEQKGQPSGSQALLQADTCLAAAVEQPAKSQLETESFLTSAPAEANGRPMPTSFFLLSKVYFMSVVDMGS